MYEYMPNGTPAKLMSSNSKEGKIQTFNWKKLHEIALRIAREIEYLHKKSDVCTLHLEIKPQNILLDHYFIPKITNVGMVKFHPKEHDLLYTAPELKSRKVVGSADARKSTSPQLMSIAADHEDQLDPNDLLLIS